MPALEEIPDQVKQYFDYSRPGWREPFEQPPDCRRRQKECLVDHKDGHVRIRLECGHIKHMSLQSSMIIDTATLNMFCDICAVELQPQIERLVEFVRETEE